jgi:hypothetical protein
MEKKEDQKSRGTIPLREPFGLFRSARLMKKARQIMLGKLLFLNFTGL